MLTLTEETLLLLCDDSGAPLPIQQDVLGCALAGAALMDLAFAWRIDTDLEALFVSDATPTGNPMLDSVLEKVVARTNNTDTGTWIRQLSVEDFGPIHELALASLATRGIFERRDRGHPWRLLFPGPRRIDGARLRDSRQRIGTCFFPTRYPTRAISP